ncbi:MAG: ATP-binding protein, partial [Halorientalis sp.]
QLLIFICGVLLVRFAIRSARIYKAQTVAILVGAGGPWVGNFLYWFGYVPFNPAPIAFAVTGLALAWAVIWAGFLNVAPIGRRAVIDDLYAAVVTLDRDHQVVEINAYARQILGYDERDSLIGRHVDELFASRSQLREVYWSMVDSADGPDCEVEFDGQYYDVDLTTLTNDRGQLVGRSLLVRDITDRKRRETELEDKNERLERFASVVSHDLRNPLNVIGGRVEIARADDEVEPHLTAIEDSTDRMEAIIEDVLTLTRRGTALEFEPINLRDVAQTAWNHVETGDATLDVTSDNTIEGDRTQVTQLFENLFRNAIEHTQEDGDGTVTVRVGSLTDGREGFFVEDDGPGIPAETRPEVLEDGYTTSAEGTGLGLTIVSDIATAHGWELTLTDSTAGGARFEIAREPAETQTGSSRNATAE